MLLFPWSEQVRPRLAYFDRPDVPTGRGGSATAEDRKLTGNRDQTQGHVLSLSLTRLSMELVLCFGQKETEKMRGVMVLSEHLAHLTATLGISFDELAQVLGTDRKTVYRWIADETFPQTNNRARLDELAELVDRLDETFKTKEGAATWLRSRSGYFGGLRPVDALLRGRIDAVDAALEALDSGIFV